MGLSNNDQKLIKYLLGQQLIGAEAVVRYTLEASERNTSFLQVLLDAQAVDAALLKPFQSIEYPETVQSQSEDDSQTVISSESQRLAMSGSGPDLLPPQSSLPRPNSPFGPFMLYEMIGQGGMGMVFRAKHIDLDRECAVKILVSQDNAVDEALIRFTSEAKTFAQLDQHPHIVRVIDAGQVGRSYYISMELVEGMSFREAVVKGQLDLRTRVKYVAQIADALVAVHGRGIIHRDIKPGNILVNSESAKLTDFGIAKNTPKANGLTITGSVLGTLAYMPPEQAEDSKDIGFQADIYSLGAVLYFALTGRAPHVGASSANVIASLLTRAPERPRALNPKIPGELEKIVLKAMSRNPADRYQTAASLRETLIEYLEKADAAGFIPEKVAPRRTAPRSRKNQKKPSALPALMASIIAIFGLAGTAFILVKNETQKIEMKAEQEQDPLLRPAKLLALNLVEGQWVTTNKFEISGRTNQGADQLTLLIDGEKQRTTIDDAHGFVSTCILKDGVRELKIIEAGRPDSSPLALVHFKVDSSKPKIELEAFDKSTVQSTMKIRGAIVEDHLVSATLNNRALKIVNSRFEETLTLKMGENSFTISATDEAGHVGAVQFNITRAALKPLLKLKPYQTLTREKTCLFKGTVFPAGAVLTINSQPVKLTGEAFIATVPLNEGRNKIAFELKYLTDVFNQVISITRDSLAPELTMESPGAQFRGTTSKVLFSVRSGEESQFQLLVGKRIESTQAGTYEMTFKRELEFADGLYSYKVIAGDRAGNKAELNGQFLVDSTGPDIDFDVDLKKSNAQKLAFKGTVKDLSKITRFKLGSQKIAIKGDGRFSVRIFRSKLKSGLFFEAIDELGNTSKIAVQLDLVLLSDWKKWQLAGTKKEGRRLQDAEIQIVGKRLGKAFKLLGTKLYRCGGEPFRIATFIHKKTAMEFNLIPGGRFLMGNKVAPGEYIGVAPPCPVKLKPFLLGRFEVKQKEWRVYDQTVVPGEPGPELPMSRISWLDVEKWLKKAGRDGGGSLRLPSEAEWEYACRAASTTDYFWGKDFDQSYVWSSESAGGTVQAGRRHEAAGKWNAFGLIDMLGNVWEWTADSASPGYDVTPPPKDGRPYKEAGNKGYMNRGGFWGSKGIELKQWFRDSTKEDHVSNQLGARFAVSIPEK